MPFSKQCASKAMHEEWGGSSTQSIRHRSKIPHQVVNKLLELSKINFNNNASFCEGCIKKVVECYPLLLATKRQTCESGEQPIKKRTRGIAISSVPEDTCTHNVGTQTYVCEHTIHTQTTEDYVDLTNMNRSSFDNMSIEKKKTIAYFLGLMQLK